MDITDIVDELAEIRPDSEDATDGLKLIMAKVGQMAQGGMILDEAEEAGLEDERFDEVRRDMVAGTIIACVEYAKEHDIDLEQAVEERLETMREQAEQREAIEEAQEAGDAAALADALGADAQEVPTGDDGDERGVY